VLAWLLDASMPASTDVEQIFCPSLVKLKDTGSLKKNLDSAKMSQDK